MKNRITITFASIVSLALLAGCMPDVAATAGTAAELKRQEMQGAKQAQDRVMKSMEAANQRAAAQAASAADAQ